MKVQISNLEALERLLGGDTELEIEIRNSVVQNFANKHLKAVAKDLLDKGITKGVEKFIRDEFFITDSWGHITCFNPKTKELLDRQITDIVRKEVDLAIKEKIDFNVINKTVNERLSATLDYIDTELKSKEMDRRLGEMVTKRIRESLNLH